MEKLYVAIKVLDVGCGILLVQGRMFTESSRVPVGLCADALCRFLGSQRVCAVNIVPG